MLGMPPSGSTLFATFTEGGAHCGILAPFLGGVTHFTTSFFRPLYARPFGCTSPNLVFCSFDAPEGGAYFFSMLGGLTPAYPISRQRKF